MNPATLTVQPVASPHAHGGNSVTRTMFRVQMALVPATLYGFWLFGWPSFFLWLLTILSCLGFEALSLQMMGGHAHQGDAVRRFGAAHRLAAGADPAALGAVVGGGAWRLHRHRHRQAGLRRGRTERLQPGDGRPRRAAGFLPAAADAVGGAVAARFAGGAGFHSRSADLPRQPGAARCDDQRLAARLHQDRIVAWHRPAAFAGRRPRPGAVVDRRALRQPRRIGVHADPRWRALPAGDRHHHLAHPGGRAGRPGDSRRHRSCRRSGALPERFGPPAVGRGDARRLLHRHRLRDLAQYRATARSSSGWASAC